MLIVGNPAGTQHDAGQFQARSTMRGNTNAQTFSQAESVSYHLAVPVLRHNSPKPARYSCIKSIRTYFSTLRVPIEEVLEIVGDRIFTDVVMANRMRGSGRTDLRDADRWRYGRLASGKGRA